MFKETDITTATKKKDKSNLTTENMAMNIVELFGDFDTDLMQRVEKTVIDYYLKGDTK